jgi:hypothetical protein
MVPVYLPKAMALTAAPTANDCAPVPEVLESVIHGALGVACQLPKELPPGPAILTFCCTGLPAPNIVLKKMLDGETGGADAGLGLTVTETLTGRGDPVAPAEEIVRVPAYEPGSNVPGSA